MMRSSFSSLLLVATAAITFACGGATAADDTNPAGSGAGSSVPAPSGSASGDQGARGTADEARPPKTGAPETARPESAACSGTRPPGDAFSHDDDTCTSDAECTEGSNGRCTFWNGRRSCSYDDCATDDDCGGGTAVCGCGIGRGERNVCLTLGNCRTNADCEGGQYCAFSRLPGWSIERSETFHGQSWGYFCTTTSDACRSDADCASNPHDHTCVYYTSAQSWGCGGGP